VLYMLATLTCPLSLAPNLVKSEARNLF
jgi:hypothetical protein